MATTIKQQRMMDTWMTIVLNGAGTTERIYTATEEALENSKLPSIAWTRDDVNAGFLGSTRELLSWGRTIPAFETGALSSHAETIHRRLAHHENLLYDVAVTW